MTARCIPEEPHFGDGHVPERTVWRALREALPDAAILLHSVPLTERSKQREIDLIIVWPDEGVAVIEVKGGLVESEGRAWTQNGKSLDESPFDQVRDARHMLRRYLKDRGAKAAGLTFAEMVALPATRVATGWSAPGAVRDMLIDRDQLDGIDAAVLGALRTYSSGALTSADAEEVVRALEGQLVGQQSLLSLSWEAQQHADALTEDEAKKALNINAMNRLQVIGGAGSGKTWLALAHTRQLVRSGQRVALVCYSRGLARFFQRATEEWPRAERPAYVGLFHRLPMPWGAPEGEDDDPDYWEVRLPAAMQELATGRSKDELFDAVIVDEGQDFGATWWPATLALLRDPSRGLFVFLDEAQRVFARHGEIPLDLPIYSLTANIRNTKRIAQTFGSLAGTQMTYRGLEGPPVRFVQCDASDAVDRADDEIDRLLADEWKPGDIALLTTQQRHQEQRNIIDTHGWESYWDSFFDDDDVFYGHVLGFKGLERSVVVLAVNGFKQAERAKEMLYVGLSRARAQLVVCGDLAVIKAAGGEGVRRRLAEADQGGPLPVVEGFGS